MTIQARVGGCGWATIGGKKRPVVILAIEENGDIFVAYGSKQPHDDFGVPVIFRPGTPQGNAFRGMLTVDTYFYRNHYGYVRSVEVWGIALGPMIVQLRRLIEPPP